MKQGKIGVLVVILVLTLMLIPCLMAQVKKDAQTGLDRVAGTIQSINKDTSTIMVRPSGQNVTWKVVFSKDTKITFNSAAATADEFKDGRRVVCLGKMEQDKLIASQIDVRQPK